MFEPQTQDETSGVSAFFGTWSGEETDAELLAALDENDHRADLRDGLEQRPSQLLGGWKR